MSDELANKVFGIVVNKFYVEGDPSCESIYAFCPTAARRVAANALAIWQGFVLLHTNSSLRRVLVSIGLAGRTGGIQLSGLVSPVRSGTSAQGWVGGRAARER